MRFKVSPAAWDALLVTVVFSAAIIFVGLVVWAASPPRPAQAATGTRTSLPRGAYHSKT